MATLTVSLDAKGNLQCPDISGYINESITWTPDGTTISSIVSITATLGSFNPAPSARNNWTGTIASDGTKPGGNGPEVDYTIVANPVNTTLGQKQKSPKIAIPPVEDKATNLKSKALHATKN